MAEFGEARLLQNRLAELYDLQQRTIEEIREVEERLEEVGMAESRAAAQAEAEAHRFKPPAPAPSASHEAPSSEGSLDPQEEWEQGSLGSFGSAMNRALGGRMVGSSSGSSAGGTGLGAVPLDVISICLSFLPAQGLFASRAVCYQWDRCVQNLHTWEEHFIGRWCLWEASEPIQEDGQPHPKVAERLRQNQGNHFGAYVREARVTSNLKRGRAPCGVVAAHDNMILHVAAHANLAATLCEDKSFKIWSIPATGGQMKGSKGTGPAPRLLSAQKVTGRLSYREGGISFIDPTSMGLTMGWVIQVVSLRTMQQTWYQHLRAPNVAPIRCMAAPTDPTPGGGRTIFTGHGDGAIKIWDTRGNQLAGNLGANIRKACAEMAMAGTEKVVGLYEDSFLRVWDRRKNGAALWKVKMAPRQAFCEAWALCANPRAVFYGAGDGSVCALDLDDLQNLAPSPPRTLKLGYVGEEAKPWCRGLFGGPGGVFSIAPGHRLVHLPYTTPQGQPPGFLPVEESPLQKIPMPDPVGPNPAVNGKAARSPKYINDGAMGMDGCRAWGGGNDGRLYWWQLDNL